MESKTIRICEIVCKTRALQLEISFNVDELLTLLPELQILFFINLL